MRPSLSHLLALAAATAFLAGIILRLYPSAGYRHAGFDEVLYRTYVQALDAAGLLNYDAVNGAYLIRQRRPETQAELPPTRFLYIFCGWVWKRATYGQAPPVDLREPGAYDRDPILLSLRHVSALATIGLLALSGVMAWRMAGRTAGVGVLWLMACAPLQLHMSQHALIDGFFAFWAMLALWGLWESLRHPRQAGWLALYGVALVGLVLTKENAFFVYLGLLGLLGVNRWAKFGEVSRPLLAVTVLAPLVAVAILTALAGGVAEFVETYRLLVTKAQHLDYAIQTGDGPWYRYLVDLLLLSPLTLLLAVGAMFCVLREQRGWLYAGGFIVVTYFIMCQVRYGMNLRYTTVWDLPLRLLVYAQLGWIARPLGRKAAFFLPMAVALLCTYDLWQYRLFFVQKAIYELGPVDLLDAVRILKVGP